MAFPAPFHRTAGRSRRTPVPALARLQAPAPATGAPRSSRSSVPGAAELVERLTLGGDAVRFTDRTDGRRISPAVQHVALEVLESWVSRIEQRAVPDHVATVRVRIVETELVISVQTASRSADVPTYVPDLVERARLGEVVAEHGGRLLARATADLNWIVIVHLPLDAPAG